MIYHERGITMESIRPSSDLRNKYPELSSMTRETGEPIYITVNGHEDTVLMGHAQYGHPAQHLPTVEQKRQRNSQKKTIPQQAPQLITKNFTQGPDPPPSARRRSRNPDR